MLRKAVVAAWGACAGCDAHHRSPTQAPRPPPRGRGFCPLPLTANTGRTRGSNDNLQLRLRSCQVVCARWCVPGRRSRARADPGSAVRTPSGPESCPGQLATPRGRAEGSSPGCRVLSFWGQNLTHSWPLQGAERPAGQQGQLACCEMQGHQNSGQIFIFLYFYIC